MKRKHKAMSQQENEAVVDVGQEFSEKDRVNNSRWQDEHAKRKRHH